MPAALRAVRQWKPHHREGTGRSGSVRAPRSGCNARISSDSLGSSEAENLSQAARRDFRSQPGPGKAGTAPAPNLGVEEEEVTVT